MALRSHKAAPSNVPPTPIKGSSTVSPFLVKVFIKSAHSNGGFCPPCCFLKLCCKSGG